MHRCNDCKIVLDSDVRFCPQCGKSVDGGQAPQQVPDVKVSALLTSANLYRIRQEWDKAINDATEALKLDPNNADIASLLGCIYEERGVMDQAVEWYQTALDLNPNSTADKFRLDRVRSKLPIELTDSFGKFMKRSKLSAFVLAGAFILIVVIAISTLSLRNKFGEPPAHKSAQAPDLPGMRARSAGTYSSQSAPRVTSAAPTRSRSTNDSPSVRVSPAPAMARTVPEAYLKGELTAANGVHAASANVDDVIADPRAGIVTVTFSVPVRGSVSKTAIIRAATEIARTVFASNQQAKFVTARCIVTPGGPDAAQVAFVGDIARETIQALPNQPTDEQLTAAFTRPWWNPEIK